MIPKQPYDTWLKMSAGDLKDAWRAGVKTASKALSPGMLSFPGPVQKDGVETIGFTNRFIPAASRAFLQWHSAVDRSDARPMFRQTLSRVCHCWLGQYMQPEGPFASSIL